MWPKPKGRAETALEKEEILRRLRWSWMACPQMRLGQLIANSIGDRSPSGRRGECFSILFNIEDDELAESVFMFAEGIEK